MLIEHHLLSEVIPHRLVHLHARQSYQLVQTGLQRVLHTLSAEWSLTLRQGLHGLEEPEINKTDRQ